MCLLVIFSQVPIFLIYLIKLILMPLVNLGRSINMDSHHQCSNIQYSLHPPQKVFLCRNSLYQIPPTNWSGVRPGGKHIILAFTLPYESSSRVTFINVILNPLCLAPLFHTSLSSIVHILFIIHWYQGSFSVLDASHCLCFSMWQSWCRLSSTVPGTTFCFTSAIRQITLLLTIRNICKHRHLILKVVPLFVACKFTYTNCLPETSVLLVCITACKFIENGLDKIGLTTEITR